MQLQEILAEVQSYHPAPDLEAIRKAHAFTMRHHKGQTRASGEPFVTHVQEVAYLAAKLQLDVPSIVTSLLHDTVEDTGVTLDEIGKEFGKDIAELVDGVTKLSKIQFSSREEEQAENFRKMLLAMSRDIRVLLLKLCDRTHNMRTLEFLSESRRKRIAQETIDIYAPLAHRLGIYWMKSELEDLGLRHLKPEIYENLKKRINESKSEREQYIKEVVQLISNELKQNEIAAANVSGRSKHFFSIYSKMTQQNLSFDEIYDLIAFRIIVPTTRECYAAVGVIHAAWRPIPGRFKDYIAMPKPNNYQSLHTTVVGPRGHRIEIQIRTEEMHEIAEKGIAAHWHYKDAAKGGKAKDPADVEFTWLQDLVESGKMLRDPVEFMSSVKEDLFPHEVFVFSPKGDLIALSQDATPIDFAYHIHSEVGHHCQGARVNGKQVPLSYRLKNGDAIEIVTSDSQKPSKDWLSLVVTTKAKQRIRSWIKAEERKRSITIGRELLGKDLRKVKLSLSKVTKDGSLKKVANDLSYKEIELLYAEIGYGKVSTKMVVGRLLPDVSNLEEKLNREDSTLQKIFKKAARAFKDKSGITVHGMDDVVFRFAKCCEPLPGDELVGYVTRGRGVAVHKRGCPQTLSFDPRRLVAVSWDTNAKMERPVTFRVHCMDEVGMLASLTQSISSIGINILNLQVGVQPNGKAICTFEVKIESASQLDDITRKVEAVDGVLRVERRRKPV